MPRRRRALLPLLLVLIALVVAGLSLLVLRARTPAPTDVRAGDVHIELLPLRRVHGRVTAAAGRPVVGAIVRAAGADGSDLDPVTEDRGWLTMERFAVAADGSFDHRVAIVDPGFRVRAEAPGWAPTVVDGGDGPLRIVLERGVAVSGVVERADGDPAAGAWIGLTRIADGADPATVSYPGAWGPPVRAVADARGRFEVTGLERHRYLSLARIDGRWAVRAAVEAPDRMVQLEVPRTDAD